jgi:hypothetical protein
MIEAREAGGAGLEARASFKTSTGWYRLSLRRLLRCSAYIGATVIAPALAESVLHMRTCSRPSVSGSFLN